MNRNVLAALDGAWAGAAATLPMSAVMVTAKRMGWMGQYPPELIVDRGFARAGVHPRGAAEDVLAMVAHLGFGACAGTIFGALRRALASRPSVSVASGVAYGLLVYAVSYKGWIPAVHILPQPEHDRPGRQSSMIAAHVVYGAALGALLAGRRT